MAEELKAPAAEAPESAAPVQDSPTKPDAAPQGKPEEFMGDTIDWIEAKQRLLAEEAPSAQTKPSETSQASPESQAQPNKPGSGTDIPDEFVEAARAAGFTDEDIKDTAASMTDEELLDLLPFLQEHAEEPIASSQARPMASAPARPDAAPADQPGALSSPEAQPPQVPVASPITADPDLKEFTDRLRAEIRQDLMKELAPHLTQMQQESQRREAIHVLSTANAAFDKASEEFEIFGKTESLPKFPSGPLAGRLVPTSPQCKARAEVFSFARGLMDLGRAPGDAMDDAIAWYRGKHGQVAAQRKLIRDLKGQETRLSGSRMGREVQKKFDNPRDEDIAYIRGLQAKAGMLT